jgi:two-component system response regulator
MHKILIIDDQPAVRLLFKEAFETAGYQVVEAPDGQAGIDTYVSEGADLIITDIEMPHRDGHEVIDEIRKKDKNAKIIAVTGAGLHHLPVAHDMGVDRIFEKPLRPSELLDAARELIS